MGNDDQGFLILNDNGNKTLKPKSLLQAVSEIEQFSVAEINSELPEGSLPIMTCFSFYEVGAKSGLLSGLITAVMTPLMMAASEQLIPVFGEYSPNTFNKIFSLTLTVSFPISYALFLCTLLTKSYAGTVTKKAINYLVSGFGTGASVKTILVVILFHFMAFRFFSEESIISALYWLDNLSFIRNIGIDYDAIFDWLMRFKLILIPSSYFILTVNGLVILIVVSSLFIGRYKTKYRREFLQEWE